MKEFSEFENKKRLLNSRIGEHFWIYPERPGRPLFTKAIKRLYSDWGARRMKERFTIDFILEPKQSALDEGWELGSVGVEAKPSRLTGKSFGRAVAQILDYQAARFSLPSTGVEERELSMIFLLGPDRFHGSEASILMQEGIGIIRISDFQGEVKFLHGNGMHPIVTMTDSAIHYRRPRFGMGSGHR